MIAEKIHPLWKIPLSSFVAVDNNLNIIAKGDTEDHAYANAVIKNHSHPQVLSGWHVQRPLLDEKDFIIPSLVLVGEEWEDGQLFVIKKYAKAGHNEISLQGIYLSKLFARPYLMLSERLPDRITVYTELSRRRLNFAWEPVMTEIEKYIPQIQDFCKKKVFNSSLSTSKKLNKEINNEFAELMKFIKKGGFPKRD
jgi:hypothetical protein